jgi:hypothetical protein
MCLDFGIRGKRGDSGLDDSLVEILNPVEQEVAGELRSLRCPNFDESERRIPRCENNIGGIGKGRQIIQVGLAKIGSI